MLQPKIVEQVEFRTLEDFAAGMNNYYAHFYRDNPFGESRRIKPHFIRFKSQNPEMEQELTDRVTRVMGTTRTKNDLPLEQMWESYKLMSQLVYEDDPGVMRYSHPNRYLLS